MARLDEIDLEILTLLSENARRPYSEIGESVGLSGPAVSDRVTRLRESGVITGFTINVDRSQLQGGIPVFVQATVPLAVVDQLQKRLARRESVEHVFVTAEGELWFSARVQQRRIHRWLADVFDTLDDVSYAVTLLDGVDWQPSLDGTMFALSCAECGNTVDSEGESSRIEGDLYHFCCSSCQERFEAQYNRLKDGI